MRPSLSNGSFCWSFHATFLNYSEIESEGHTTFISNSFLSSKVLCLSMITKMSERMISEIAISQFKIFMMKRYFSLYPRFCQLILSGVTESVIKGNFLKIDFLFKLANASMQHFPQQFLMQYLMHGPYLL